MEFGAGVCDAVTVGTDGYWRITDYHSSFLVSTIVRARLEAARLDADKHAPSSV
jgi:hypothetical protein